MDVVSKRSTGFEGEPPDAIWPAPTRRIASGSDLAIDPSHDQIDQEPDLVIG